ncbi:helix-turn-helix transcriptional regulator [Aquitalea sp. ASV15]|uniref:helix-turn-helix transcriptional regulator n=1 Tax=Aquitalea sp. ASV15 TaxID=2795104 RepID=UPI0018EA9562|nr:helix-turn-helix transcriptional regulator [Aquitalea sp. ASV15]
MQLAVADLAFHQRLGRLMEKLGEPGFWPALARLLADVITFDTWVVLLFQPEQAPHILADHAANLAAADLFADYRAQLYRIDPFYAFSQQQPASGLYRLDHVAPDSFRDTEYFRQYFSRNVGADELQFLLPIPGQGVLSLSLGSRRRFTDVEIGACQLFSPWLLPMMGKAMRLDAYLTEQLRHNPAERQLRLEDALRQRGEPHLTEREVQVALLVLAGHSTKAVARELGISLDTAKVHRRNLYAKLGVSNQAGLFLLFSAPSAAAAD